MQAHSFRPNGWQQIENGKPHLWDGAATTGSGNGNCSGHLKRQPTEEGLKSKCKLHCSDGMSGSK
jgi:hypothetical protein